MLRFSPRMLEKIDHGSTPDFPTGAAILKLLHHVGGDTAGLTITRR